MNHKYEIMKIETETMEHKYEDCISRTIIEPYK